MLNTWRTYYFIPLKKLQFLYLLCSSVFTMTQCQDFHCHNSACAFFSVYGNKKGFCHFRARWVKQGTDNRGALVMVLVLFWNTLTLDNMKLRVFLIPEQRNKQTQVYQLQEEWVTVLPHYPTQMQFNVQCLASQCSRRELWTVKIRLFSELPECSQPWYK